LLLFVALIALAAVTIAITTRKITRSILDLSREMNRIAEFHVGDESPEGSALREIHTMQTSMAGMKKALRSFGKYVPADVVRRLVRTKREARLGVEPAEVTIFFSDIEDFTRLSERIPHDTLVEMMGEYLDELSDIILGEGGTVDKYIGDAIMAFWNAPEPVENHRAAAVRAALACQERKRELNTRWAEKDLPPLRTRIGLHTGSVLVGNLGSNRRMNYTIIGDPVNLGARLESLNKVYGTGILISGAVHGEIAEQFLCRPIDRVVVKGKTEPIRIYEPIAAVDDVTGEQRDRVAFYKDALDLYFAARFAEAADAFDYVLDLDPDDLAARLLRDRAARYRDAPPPEDWDGAYHLDHK
jgi:adenylate cyclase